MDHQEADTQTVTSTEVRPIRLVIADDHEVIRSGLVSLMKDTEIEIVAQASTGKEVIDRVSETSPDVVLLDIRMTEGDGLQALEQIRAEHPALPVLILSTYDNPTYVARAVALEASGYLLKGAGRDRLLSAIRMAAAGESAWRPEDLRRVSRAAGGPTLAADVEIALTKRESEVLRQLAFGLSNKEIARRLAISYETVKEHVQHILRKVGVADRTQAAVWAVRKGLV
ncbi:MAG: response regulator transcription factor [Pirellulales bacterium]|nr:response regulator transcription factor [Pirellulales bacterium]